MIRSIFTSHLPKVFAILSLGMIFITCNGGYDAHRVIDEGFEKEPEYMIRFAHVVRPTVPKGRAAEKFAQLVEERSHGRIRVIVYPDGQLGNDQEILEKMLMGVIEMNAPFMGVMPSFVRQFQIFDLPFLFPDKQTVFEATHGAIGERLNEYLMEIGLYSMGYWDGGFKHFTNDVRPITSVDDINGLKMRSSQSPLLIAQFRTLNAGGISVPLAELYTALQNRTVDGQENSLSNIVTRRFYEVQNFLTLSAHGYLGYVLLINNEFYENLPPDLQAILDKAAFEVSEWQWELAAQDEERYLDYLHDTGIQINHLTDEARQGFMEKTGPVYDQFRQIPGGEGLLDLIREIRGY